ncbi:MAG: phage tail tape measure protein [Thermodesulfovibrionales bacterium]|nr:phage tail tape measure protein [Thermodesulfovibrionales bacterium]
MLTPLTAIGGGAAIMMAAKGVIDFDARLARLAISSGKTGKEFFKLKDELFAMAEATHQTPGALLEGISAIVEKTGDYDFAIKSLRSMGIVASATNTSMEDIGATTAGLMQKMGISSGQVFEVLDVLHVQAKSGAVEFRNFAGLIDNLTSATGRFNLKGVEGVRVMGAWVQSGKLGAGSAEQTVTGIEMAIAEMLDMKNIKKMRKWGFNPIDEKATKKSGVTVMKPLQDILKGVIKATKGDEIKLGEVFGQRSIRVMSRLAAQFRLTGGFEEFDNFINQGGSGVETLKDFAFWADTTKAKIGDLMTQFSKFSNENLAAPIELLNKALTILNKHPILTKSALWAVLGVLGIGGAKTIGGLFKPAGGTKGIGGVLGGLGRGPLPVYVVNKHLSMLPGQGWGFPGEGGGVPGSGVPGKGRKLFGMNTGPNIGFGVAMANLPLITAAAAAGYGIGTFLNEYMANQLGIKHEGGAAGYAGEKLYDKMPNFLWAKDFVNFTAGVSELNEQTKKQEIKNDIVINLQVDEKGKVISDTDDMNTKVKLNRGNLVK